MVIRLAIETRAEGATADVQEDRASSPGASSAAAFRHLRIASPGAASAGSIAGGLRKGLLTPESAAERIENEVKKALYDFIRKEKDIARLENEPRGF